MKTGHYAAALRTFEQGYFTALLQAHGWRVSKVANFAGLDRTHIYRKLHKLGILKRKGAA